MVIAPFSSTKAGSFGPQTLVAERTCEQCNSPFLIKASQLKYQGYGRFCTRACHYTYQHRLRRVVSDGQGYQLSTVGPPRKRKRQHVVVAEIALGHELPDGAVVHHVDGHKSNNRN